MIYTTKELDEMRLRLAKDIQGYTDDMKKAVVRGAFLLNPRIRPLPPYYALAKELGMMEEIELELKLHKLKEGK
jgi:hypothetical protein